MTKRGLLKVTGKKPTTVYYVTSKDYRTMLAVRKFY